MNKPRKNPDSDQSSFQRFQRLLKGLVAVPKEEVKVEEERWRAARLKKKKPAV